MALTRSQLKKESTKPVATAVTTAVACPTNATPKKAATSTVSATVVATKSGYSLRPRNVVVTVSHTVSPYNLRPRVKTA